MIKKDIRKYLSERHELAEEYYEKLFKYEVIQEKIAYRDWIIKMK